MVQEVDATLEDWAMAEAKSHLANVGSRWIHSEAVGAKARRISHICAPDDRSILVAAAYLHDIGKAPDLAITKIHQLDGARFVAEKSGNQRLASLIAHHTEARFEIERHGYRKDLSAYSNEHSLVSNVLTFCDLTIGPTGLPEDPLKRIGTVIGNYGSGPIVEALSLAMPSLMKSFECVSNLLRDAGYAEEIPSPTELSGP